MNYYLLKLNNAYDVGNHRISLQDYTVAKGIITKELNSLLGLEDALMSLDDTITENLTTYTAKGSFPIIAIKKEDKVYDVITGKRIKYSSDRRDVNGLSYSEIHYIDRKVAESLLRSLTDSERAAYINYLERLEEYSQRVFYLSDMEEDYYLFTPANIRIDAPKAIGRDVNGTIVDVVTNKSFYEIDYKTVSLDLGYYDKYQVSTEYAREYALFLLEEGIDSYKGRINEARINSRYKYNDYIERKVNPKRRILHK